MIEYNIKKFFDDAFINSGSNVMKQHVTSEKPKYPFYNIIQTDETNWVIEMALAGYSKNNITVSLEEGDLIVSGKQIEEEDKNYIHRGIALRSFKKSFKLNEWHVIRSAKMENGILSIEVELVIPEERKPKVINID